MKRNQNMRRILLVCFAGSLALFGGCHQTGTQPSLEYHVSQGKLEEIEKLIKNGRLEQAITLLEARALKQSSGQALSPKVHLLLGQAYEEQGKKFWDKSIAAYEQASSLQVSRGYRISDPAVEHQARLRLAKLYNEMGKYNKTIEILSLIPPEAGSNPEVIRELALGYLGAKNEAASQVTWERLQEITPHNPEAEYYIGLIKERKNLYEEAVEHYRKVQEFGPWSAWAGLAKQQLAQIETKTRKGGLDQIEDEEVRRLIKEAPGEKEYPDAGVIILLDEREITVSGDNTRIERRHRLIKILNERGKMFGEVKLSYDSSYQTVEVALARTIKQDGAIINVGKKSMRDLTPWEGFPLYSNVKVKVISMPEVVEGSIIEYTAVTHSSKLLAEKHFQAIWGIQSREPRLLQRFRLLVPSSKMFSAHYVRLPNLSPKVESNVDWQTYTWVVRDMKGIIPEPLMPSWSDVVPFLYISSFPNWGDVGGWFQKLSAGQFEVTEDIRKETAELTSGVGDPKEKARRIFKFVAATVRYVGLEYGVSGYKPHKAGDIFSNKYGDCKDQSTLLAAMLREAGLSAYLALVGTKDNGKLEADIPMLQFNHCIVAVKLGDEMVWLDPTCDICGLDDIPSNIQGSRALVCFEEGSRFLEIPIVPSQQNKITRKTELKIQSDGSIIGATKSIATGDYALDYRGLRYSKPVSRKNMLRGIISNLYPGGKLLDYSFHGIENQQGPVTTVIEYSGPNFMKKAGDLSLFSIPGTGRSAISVAREERRYPIQFDVTSWREIQTKITLPPQYKVRYLPGEINMNLPASSFWSKYEVHNDQILYRERSITKKLEIPVADYSSYKAYRERIAQESDRQIILEKK